MNHVSGKLELFSLDCKGDNQPTNAVVSVKNNGMWEIISYDDFDDKQSTSAPPHFHVGIATTRSRFQRKFITLAANALHCMRSCVQSTFLPTVGTGDHSMETLSRKGYLKYILYDNIQDLSTSLRFVLAKRELFFLFDHASTNLALSKD